MKARINDYIKWSENIAIRFICGTIFYRLIEM